MKTKITIEVTVRGMTADELKPFTKRETRGLIDSMEMNGLNVERTRVKVEEENNGDKRTSRSGQTRRHVPLYRAERGVPVPYDGRAKGRKNGEDNKSEGDGKVRHVEDETG